MHRCLTLLDSALFKLSLDALAATATVWCTALVLCQSVCAVCIVTHLLEGIGFQLSSHLSRFPVCTAQIYRQHGTITASVFWIVTDTKHICNAGP